jgi:hypothetical protein
VIYEALKEAGVHLTIRDRNLFLALAKGRLETKRTHKVRKSDPEWDDMRAKLAEIDQLPESPSSSVEISTARSAALPSRMEISHLIGREQWLASLYGVIAGQPSISG